MLKFRGFALVASLCESSLIQESRWKNAFDYLCSPLTVGLKMPLAIESQQIIAKWCIPQGHLDGVGAEAWFCNICLQHLRDDEQAWDHCIGRNKKHAKNYRRMRLPTINLNAMDWQFTWWPYKILGGLVFLIKEIIITMAFPYCEQLGLRPHATQCSNAMSPSVSVSVSTSKGEEV